MPSGRPKGSKDKSPRKPRTDEANFQPKGYYKQPDIPEGFNTKAISFLMTALPEEPIDPNNVEEMRRRFRQYLEYCQMYDLKPGNLGAYAAIGITKQQVDRWEDDERNPERQDFIKKLKIFMATYREMLMAEGTVPVPVGIFWQKNYDGLKDVTEKVEVKVDATAPQLIDKIAEKYLPDEQKQP